MNRKDLQKKPRVETVNQECLSYIKALSTFEQLELHPSAQAKLLSQVFAYSNTALIITNANTFGNLDREQGLLFNPAATQLLGMDENQCKSLDWTDFFHPDERLEIISEIAGLRTENHYKKEFRYKQSSGTYLRLQMILITIDDWHICSLKPSDVQSTQILRHLKAMPMRCKADDRGTFMALTDDCRQITGYSAKQLSAKSLDELILPAYRNCIKERRAKALEEKKTTTLAYEIETADKACINVLEISSGIYSVDGRLEAVEGLLLSVDDTHTIEHFRSLDSSTNLKTSEYLKNLLEYDTNSHSHQNQALIHINLRAIHHHTVLYGFSQSEEVKERITAELKSYHTASCRLFKTFENHYTFYLTDYHSRQDLLDYCQTLSSSLRTLLQREGFACGIGLLELSENQSMAYEEAMHQIMIASEESLSIQRNWLGFCEVCPELLEQNRRKRTIITELSEIIEKKHPERLYVLFQPIVTLAANRITEFEVLSRLNSNALGPVSPVEFIPLAEQTKYIIELGALIIEQALTFLKTLQDRGHHDIKVSINISAIQLVEADFSTRLLSMIEKFGVNSSLVILEITESKLITNMEEINDLFAELQREGISIALDDFGTGYSSLSYERNLKVNTLKIDKVFIDKLVPDTPTITEYIISMA
ncbi:MAG: EAL domain-containing protein, partial [Spirochaetia bacterium]|nr:EAL domain-containing protein [Spirochaetia bacterium]